MTPTNERERLFDDVTSAKTPVSSNRRRSWSTSGIKNLKNLNTPSHSPGTPRKTVQFHGDNITSAHDDLENVAPTTLLNTATKKQDQPNTAVASSMATPYTTLFNLIKNKEWDQVIQRCEECPSEASVWILEDNNYDGSIRWKLLPIHQACEERPPDHVISALLKAYPKSALERDMGGSLPLHLACRERAHKSVADVLLHHCRKSIDFTDNEGRLPLHLACRQGVTTELIEDLLRRYYRGAMHQDMDGMLPLHWACAQGASSQVVESLLRAHPNSVNIVDKMSRSPLTILQSSSHPEKEAVLVALKRDLAYWTTSLQDEVSNLKTQLAHAASEEQSLREELTELKHRFDQVDTDLDRCVSEKAALQNDNRVLQSLCDETIIQNKKLQATNEKLQGKSKELDKVFSLMKKEQAHVRSALISMMGSKRKDAGAAAAAVVVSNVAQEMKKIAAIDCTSSFEEESSENGRFAEI